MYLTKEKKEYYQKDFEGCVERREIDGTIVKHLALINTNEHLATLYSQRGNGVLSESYLDLAFFEEKEPRIRNCVSGIHSDLSIELREPERNINCGRLSKNPESGAYSDEEYFRVRHFHFELDCVEDFEHDKFWSDLARVLSEI